MIERRIIPSPCQSYHAWLLSFGDLLTLLLCFFISLLSMARYGEQAKSELIQEIAGDMRASPENQKILLNVQNSGTPFAHHKGEAPRTESLATHTRELFSGARLLLVQDDFLSSEFQGEGPFGTLWKTKIAPLAQPLTLVEVTMCGEVERAGQEMAVSLVEFVRREMQEVRTAVALQEDGCKEILATDSSVIGFIDIS